MRQVRVALAGRAVGAENVVSDRFVFVLVLAIIFVLGLLGTR